MPIRWTTIRALCLCSLALAAIPVRTLAQPALSNRMPIALVRQLQQEFRVDPDQLPAAEAADFAQFWDVVAAAKSDPEAAVSRLFGTADDPESLSGRFPSLYPVKFAVLRFLVSQREARTDWIHKVMAAWQKRYIATALAGIELTGIPEYREIAANFRAKLAKGQVRVVDLSPAERARWAREFSGSLHKNHNEDILARDARGRYLVQGRFQESSGYFAVDFGRPVAEGLVSYGHEIVHAGDPRLQAYLDDYVNLHDKAMAAIAKAMGGKPAGALDAGTLVRSVLNETGVHPFIEAAERIRLERTKQLRAKVANPTPTTAGEVLEKEREDLRRWLRAVIGLTVENEFRAYGHSLLLYAELKSRFHILPPSEERQRFVQQFLSGDVLVAENLAMRMSPFAPGSALNGAIYSLRGDPEAYKRARSAAELIELLYLEETEKFIRGLNGRFGHAMQELAKRPAMEERITSAPVSGAGPSLLPVWARPGGMNSPTNPYQILSARITTSWVLRFRQTINVVLADLGRLNEPLFALRAGILDLHDMTLGERKLLGMDYQGSPYDSQCEGLGAEYGADLGQIPPEVVRMFTIVNWSPALSGARDFVDGTEVARNLVRLRTLKSSAWLDAAFPPAQATFMGVRVFLQKLRNGDFEAGDLSAERAQELVVELENSLKSGGALIEQKSLLNLLLEQLSAIYRVAEEAQWSGVMRSFQEKADFVRGALEVLGAVDDGKGANPVQTIAATLAQFQRQIEPQRAYCASQQSLRFLVQGGFNLGYGEFPLSMICQEGKLHLVRQPGNFVKQLPTFVRSVGGVAAPHSKVCNGGSRAIRLFPYSPPRR